MEKNFCGQIYTESWRNEVGQVKKGGVTVGDTLERGDTLVKGIKSDSDSDSDEQKKVARFFRKQWRGDTLSYRPGCHPP